MKLDCRTSREHFSDYVDGELDAMLCQPFTEHLDNCPVCARELHELKAALAVVRDLEPEAPRPGLADRVLARVARESSTDRQAGSTRAAASLERPPNRSREFARRGTPWLRVALAAAALLLIVLGVQIGWILRGPEASNANSDEIRSLVSELRRVSDDSLARNERHEKDRIELIGRLSGVEKNLEHANRALVESRGETARLGRDLEESKRRGERLAEELTQLRLAAKSTAESEQALADAREKSEQLEAKIAALTESSPTLRSEPAPVDQRSPESEQPIYADVNPSTHVSFRRGRDGVTIEFSGPRDEVIEQFVEILTDDEDAENTYVTFKAFEDLLRAEATLAELRRLDRAAGSSHLHRLDVLLEISAAQQARAATPGAGGDI